MLTNKHISIVGSVGIPAQYGGFETLVEHLTKNLSSKYQITVFCSGKEYKKRLCEHNGAYLRYINLRANGFQSIVYDIISILMSLKFADIILILGVSGCIILPLIKLFSSKKIIVNIDGIEWKRGKWNKLIKFFLRFSEKLAITYSDAVIADNKAIQKYIEDVYSKKSYLITYGADHISRRELTEAAIDKYPFLKGKYALTICRIEPENNIHIILEAFKIYNKLNIVIIGNWSNSKYGMLLREKYSKYQNIYLLDPIYEHELLNQIRSNCYIYIHGHSAGGTNPSLVEAMFSELPVVAFDVEYNRETTENRAKYFKNNEELVDLLNRLSPEDLNNIAHNLKEVAEMNYRWEYISKSYAELFK